ncbi:protein HESO1 isoform X2 [Phoenix dactylifera]|uniref:Protein HESO1 isoform X2 n=1 Tax=Phoenix dactylifera TaxID=42345 RepID=A0A8B7BI87_PHODC|nr:protein HESO1 isoform X2 [Phoenix dactylifera]XP_008777472.1 protein HESO1 isoform X2 [Phoenix dactylifera]XP_038988419.1 protein HESO1 isoform X2 [Phoenix dactylifera]
MTYYYLSHGDKNGVLERCLIDILSLIKPSETDRISRLNTIRELATFVGSLESLEGAVVKPFGSFTSNLYSKWGDLDLSVQLSSNFRISTGKNRKKDILRDIMRALRRNGVVHNLQFIPNARVPLLIYESKKHGISCDVSIDNHMGQIKSKILLWIANMDERFRDMVLLVCTGYTSGNFLICLALFFPINILLYSMQTKEWAKAQNINDPKLGTLNSFSLCLLVIFHFQTCEPAILPPLKEIYAGNIVDDISGMRFLTERGIEDVCATNITRFRSQSFRQRNQSSLSELLVSFFEKFSRIETLSSEYAICAYTGRWERIRSNPKWMGKSHSIFIEDPFEQPDNAARAVGSNKLRIISNAFMDAYHKLSSGPTISNRHSLIASLTRPHISSQLGVRTYVQHTANGVRSHQPGIGYSGYATREPIHDQFQNVLRLDRYAPSSSTVPLQGQGALNVQVQRNWRRRHPNR